MARVNGPVDSRLRKCAAECRGRGKGVNQIAHRSKPDEKNLVQDVDLIRARRSRVE